MRLDLLSDPNWEAKIAHAIRPLLLKSYFEGRCYGSGLAGLAIVLMSRDPAHAFRRRVRFERPTRILYIDVMLDLPEMRRPGHVERRLLKSSFSALIRRNMITSAYLDLHNAALTAF